VTDFHLENQNINNAFFLIFKTWLKLQSVYRSLVVSEHSPKLFSISFDLTYFKAKTVCFQELEAFSKKKKKCLQKHPSQSARQSGAYTKNKIKKNPPVHISLQQENYSCVMHQSHQR